MHEMRFHFGSYLNQMLMDFASIWLILKLSRPAGPRSGPRTEPSRRSAVGPRGKRGPGESLLKTRLRIQDRNHETSIEWRLWRLLYYFGDGQVTTYKCERTDLHIHSESIMSEDEGRVNAAC